MPVIALSTQTVIWPTTSRLGELNIVPRTRWLETISLAHEPVELGFDSASQRFSCCQRPCPNSEVTPMRTARHLPPLSSRSVCSQPEFGPGRLDDAGKCMSIDQRSTLGSWAAYRRVPCLGASEHRICCALTGKSTARGLEPTSVMRKLGGLCYPIRLKRRPQCEHRLER